MVCVHAVGRLLGESVSFGLEVQADGYVLTIF